jgi:hypothetical protein
MDSQQPALRFDWIQWLATIPGIPSDWGQPPREAILPSEPVGDAVDWPELKAA